jgi:hypothetical protein
MSNFTSINSFKKGAISNRIHEDPTFLSFFFMFDWYDSEHSPLLSGATERYLREVVGDAERADNLARFNKILKKLNMELPWFWQSITGLEKTRIYDKLSDPFWGGDDSVISITCLETVELTVTGLMDLYKRAIFDFDRWVEVVPLNMRRFRMYVIVSEVRTFKSKSKPQSTVNTADPTKTGGQSISGVLNSKDPNDIVDTKPFFQVMLGHCEFDIDSTNEVFSSLSKNPEEAVSPTINIRFETTSDVARSYSNSIGSSSDSDSVSARLIADIEKEGLGDRLKGRIQSALDNTGINRETLTRAAFNTISGRVDSAVGNITGQLVLGNVYGANNLSTIQDAIRAGSINAIANSVGQLANSNTASVNPTQLKSSSLEPKNIYEGQQTQSSSLRVPRDLGNAY